MRTFRPLLALSLVVLAFATPAQAADLSTIPSAPDLPVESPVPLPDTPSEPPSVCFAYNPQAATNMCFVYSPRTVAAPGPIVEEDAGLCLVGDQCLPGVTVEQDAHVFPMYGFYVEVTRACPFLAQQCRVEN